MKKQFLIASALIVGVAAGVLGYTKSYAEAVPTTHSCVMVASSPTNGTISCIGDGKVCTVVGDCVKQ